MALNNSGNATLQGEKRKRLVIPNFVQNKQGESSSQTMSQVQQIALLSPLPPPPQPKKGFYNLTLETPTVNRSSVRLHSSTLMKDIKSLDLIESLKLASSFLSKNLVSLSTSEDRAKVAETKVQELSL